MRGAFGIKLELKDASVVAGFPSPADDYTHETLDFNRDYIRHPEATFYAKVEGDSMKDAGIFDGDRVIIDRAVEPHDGSIVVAWWGGEGFTMKYLDLTHRKCSACCQYQSGKRCTALVLHGWRNSSIDFLFLARIYDKEMGYNVVIPDFHAHGLSEGEDIQMGWKDADDMMQWLRAFKADTMVIHGVSMGAATTMMLSSRQMPEGIKEILFFEDCGYTIVWDEFAGQLKL